MSKIIIKDDFLSIDEHIFLKKVCENFYPTSTPEQNYHYFKQTIEDCSHLKHFIEKSKYELLSFKHEFNDMISIGEVWVNKVTPKTNTNDKVHVDINQLTSITFLNEDFEGGKLEIKQKENIVISPKKGRTLFFEGSKMAHRVLPVTNGERFTLVAFWNWKSKTSNSLV